MKLYFVSTEKNLVPDKIIGFRSLRDAKEFYQGATGHPLHPNETAPHGEIRVVTCPPRKRNYRLKTDTRTYDGYAYKQSSDQAALRPDPDFRLSRGPRGGVRIEKA